MGLINAWSYSRWSTYDKCPKQAQFKYVDKLSEEENAAMIGGKEAHDEIAEYLRGDRQGPVRGWEHFQVLFEQLRDLEPLIEQQWGFRVNWTPTGWFAKDTWFRSVLDAAVIYDDATADVVDHKTGKSHPSHAQQAELYAVSVFLRYPHVARVTVRFWYLDSGAESVYRFGKRDADGIIATWTKRAQKMLSDTLLAPRPGAHCNWCSFAKSKGGPCKYG